MAGMEQQPDGEPDEKRFILKQFFIFAKNSVYLQMYIVAVILLVPIILRCAVAMNPHSGQGLGPRYGDFEAQRHWMEITVNLPIGEWYRESPDNQLEYWGLDYPPLTAYGSWVFGKIAAVLCPSLVELHTSRGIETPEVKHFMRMTVLVSDILILFPAVYYYFQVYYHRRPWSHRGMATFLVLCQPVLILVDHGHFQYNGVSLGLAVIAVGLIFIDWNILGGVFFCLSVLYKQIGLYYALAFFFFLLRKCLAPLRLGRLFWLAVTVVVTFTAPLLPFINAEATHGSGSGPAALAGVDGVVDIAKRVFPFDRGVFEDKVANFWCVLSFVYKYRGRFETQAVLRMSTSLTMFGSSFASFNLLFGAPTHRRFIFGLFNCSMSFFLFSYMVHEKSILFPLMPASLLILDSPVTAHVVLSFTSVAMFSMYPLWVKDGLVVPYYTLQILYAGIVLYSTSAIFSGYGREYPGEAKALRFLSRFMTGSYFGMALIHGLELFVPPPARYPDIYVYVMMAFSFAHFVVYFAIGNYCQYAYSDQNKLGILSRERVHPHNKAKSA